MAGQTCCPNNGICTAQEHVDMVCISETFHKTPEQARAETRRLLSDGLDPRIPSANGLELLQHAPQSLGPNGLAESLCHHAGLVQCSLRCNDVVCNLLGLVQLLYLHPLPEGIVAGDSDWMLFFLQESPLFAFALH